MPRMSELMDEIIAERQMRAQELRAEVERVRGDRVTAQPRPMYSLDDRDEEEFSIFEEDFLQWVRDINVHPQREPQLSDYSMLTVERGIVRREYDKEAYHDALYEWRENNPVKLDMTPVEVQELYAQATYWG